MDTDQVPMLAWFADGSAVPAVSPEDFKSVLQLCDGLRCDFNDRQKATGLDLCAQACSPGADVMAVGYRVGILQMCGHLNLLAPWLEGGDLDEAVISVAARFPMQKMQVGVIHNNLPLDFEEFAKQVEAEARKSR